MYAKDMDQWDFSRRFQIYGVEFLVFTKDSLQKDKYRYNFIVNDLIVRWDNSPHHSDIRTFPHHLHIDSRVLESQEPTLEYVLRYIIQSGEIYQFGLGFLIKQ